MTIAFKCPRCKQRHSVPDEMQGTKAKCNCGAVLTIPSLKRQPSTPQKILVQCPSCGQRHDADPSMAGTRAKCPCGQILSIPDSSSKPKPSATSSSLFDELTEDELGAPLGSARGSIPDDPLSSPDAPVSSTYLTTGTSWSPSSAKPKRRKVSRGRSHKEMPQQVVTASVALAIPGILSIVFAIVFAVMKPLSGSALIGGVEAIDLANVVVVLQLLIGFGSLGVVAMFRFRVPGARALGLVFSIFFLCGSCIHLICAIFAMVNLASPEAAEYFSD